MKPNKFFTITLNCLITGFLIFSFIFISASVSEAGNPKYSKVKIFISGKSDMEKINATGLYIDHAEANENSLETWLSVPELSKLKKSGISYQILIPDWDEYYSSFEKMSPSEIRDAIQLSVLEFNVSHSIYGSMGGYLTYSEVITKLDSMRIEYPNLISQKFSIGQSVENRDMWTVRMSNSPNAPTGRPEVWFHSLIHAREPLSMQQNIYFMYWLLENYNIDPVATYILNYRELYFTPVFNPDGYEYNRTTNPNGGGFWRKNRKQFGGNIYGVDLNRNYGIYDFWNSSNNGSSTDSTSDTYRGKSPFSEPETRNAMNFVNSRNFKGILSYHTYGNYLIRPWGFVDAPTPDENIFQNMSQDMVLDNHYTLGRSFQTVNYGVRGVTDDWYYNDSGHVKAFAMTPEVGTGTDGFWPLQSRILPLAKQNVTQNIYFAMFCGPFMNANSVKLNNEYYSPGEQGNLKVYLRNKGIANATNVRVQLVSQNPEITVQSDPYFFSNFSSFTNDSVSFDFIVSAGALNNSSYKTTLRIRQDDTNSVYTKDINIVIGSGNVIFLDSAENGTTRWTLSGGFGTTTTQSHSPTRSFTDSPTGNYSNSTTRSMTLLTPLNISSAPVVILSYWYRHSIDTLDNAYVEVSNDGGTSWRSVKFYNKTVSTWTKEVLDITSLAAGSSNLKIKFSLISNGSLTADGIYIDDIKLVNYNSIPTGITGTAEIPLSFELSQNYPNPFNPSTSINYQIPVTGNVSLKIYDISGKFISELVNKEQTAGNYEVKFNGENYSSGIYFYRLESGNYSKTMKMMLLK
ncbi:MAG: T9SS type A sorting domain-containing protein [Bacteroidetes bacterium]|nr:T9SS type A sorting domain-containing protein [Bacteroidota bacterium]